MDLENENDTENDAQERTEADISQEALSLDELKTQETYKTLGRMSASVWWGTYSELKRIGLDQESAVTAAFELTHGIIQPVIEHFLEHTAHNPQQENETRITEFLNQILANVSFNTPGN